MVIEINRSRLNEFKVPKVQIIPNNSTHVGKMNIEKRTRRIFLPTGIFNKNKSEIMLWNKTYIAALPASARTVRG